MEKLISDKELYFENILNSRVTVHHFKTEPVPRQIIDKALKSFMSTPNHFSTKPWKIYVLGRESIIKTIDLNTEEIRRQKGEKVAMLKKNRWSSVPCWILINCALNEDNIRFQEDYAACACGIQNMMLSLWSNGYGSKWTTGQVTRHERFSKIIGFDQNEEMVVGLLWCGLPNAAPVKKSRESSVNVTWLP